MTIPVHIRCPHLAIYAIQCLAFTIVFICRAASQDALGGTFGNQETGLLVSYNHGETAPFKIKWDLAYLAIPTNIERAMPHNSFIEWAFDPGLVDTVQVAKQQHTISIFLREI